MRRTGVIIWAISLALLAAGCFRVEQYIDLSDGTSAAITTVLRIDKVYSGAEMDLFVNALHQAIPAIERTSDFTRTEEELNGTTWTVYEWVGHERQSLNDLPFTLTQQADGSYSFEWLLAPVDGFSEETESDSIILSIAVALPRDVDLANTMHIEGNVATWELRKADLSRGVRLRAITR